MGLISFFKRIATWLDEHTIVADYEADLYQAGGRRKGPKVAELEYTRFKPGHATFEIELKDRCPVPEGSEVAVLIHGVEVARVTKLKLQTEVKLNTKNGDDVAPIQLGNTAELMHDGQIIASGVFKHDD